MTQYLRKPKVSKKVNTEESKPKKQKKQNDLAKKYPDTYKEEIPSKSILIDESKKIIISVKRKNDDLGLPHLDIREYQTTDFYTGFTKRGINIPLEFIDTIIEQLGNVSVECDKKGI